MAQDLDCQGRLRAADAAYHAEVREARNRLELAYTLALINQVARNRALQLAPDTDEAARRTIEHDRGI